jgi:hypothetical protein
MITADLASAVTVEWMQLCSDNFMLTDQEILKEKQEKNE